MKIILVGPFPPLRGGISMFNHSLANELETKTISIFNKMLSEASEYQFGFLELQSSKKSFPLVSRSAKEYVLENLALIGDAAVGMHPVTAHGFNLGLRGQDLLSLSISRALNNGLDIGADAVLKEFERKQINLSRLMYFGTNGIVSLFTNDDAAIKQVRKLVLKFANRFPPVKALITQHLTESKKSNLIPF